jgi:hypothetical protein
MIDEDLRIAWRRAGRDLYLCHGFAEQAVPQRIARLLLEDLSEDVAADLLRLEEDICRYAAYVDDKVADATEDVIARRATLASTFAESRSRRRRRRATDLLTATALRQAEWSARQVEMRRLISELREWITLTSEPYAAQSA